MHLKTESSDGEETGGFIYRGFEKKSTISFRVADLGTVKK
jgi:hypothetical protein